jgi:hypothetical protein
VTQWQTWIFWWACDILSAMQESLLSCWTKLKAYRMTLLVRPGSYKTRMSDSNVNIYHDWVSSICKKTFNPAEPILWGHPMIF